MSNNQQDLLQVLDRYPAGCVQAHVAEDSAGALDVALTVVGVEVAALRLRSTNLIMIHRNHRGEPVGLGPDGGQVPLPSVT